MEIRIDTNKDSKEEIRKIIKFLSDVVEGSNSSYSTPTADSVPDANPGMFGMFSEDTTTVGDINIQTEKTEYEEPVQGVYRDSSTQKSKTSTEPKIDIIPY